MMGTVEVCTMCGCEVRPGQRLWHDAWHDQIRYTLDELKDTVRNHRILLEMVRDEVYRA